MSAPATVRGSLAHARPGDAVDAGLLDSCEWAHETPVLDALGWRFRVRSTDPVLGRHVDGVLASLRTVAGDGLPTTTVSLVDLGGDGHRYQLYADDVLVRRRDRLWLHLTGLLALVNRQATWTASRRTTVLHAAGVAVDGRAALLPGRSGAGKTTLAVCLLACGADYLSDEAVALAPDGSSVAGYPKALSLERGTQALFPSLAPDVDPAVAHAVGDDWQVPPDRVGDGAVVASAQPAVLVAPRYDPRVDGAALEPVSRAAMVRSMATNAFHIGDHPARDLATLGATARATSTFTLAYGDVRAACRTVRDLLARTPEEPGR